VKVSPDLADAIDREVVPMDLTDLRLEFRIGEGAGR
jgi:hypothetical protein